MDTIYTMRRDDRHQIIQRGTRAVVIAANDSTGPFRANLYVNCNPALKGPIGLGDITLIGRTFKSLAGAVRFAHEQLA